MNFLQGILDKLIEERFVVDKLAAYVEKRLAEMGVNLSESQRREVKNKLKESGCDTITLAASGRRDLAAVARGTPKWRQSDNR